jgi:hypothetical protein
VHGSNPRPCGRLAIGGAGATEGRLDARVPLVYKMSMAAGIEPPTLMEPAVIVSVLALGFLAGYFSSKAWPNFIVVCLTGFAVMGLLLFVLWYRGHGGDGWNDKVMFQGHWINRQLSDLIGISLLLWPVGLACGVGAGRSQGPSVDLLSREAERLGD